MNNIKKIGLFLASTDTIYDTDFQFLNQRTNIPSNWHSSYFSLYVYSYVQHSHKRSANSGDRFIRNMVSQETFCLKFYVIKGLGGR